MISREMPSTGIDLRRGATTGGKLQGMISIQPFSDAAGGRIFSRHLL